MGLKKFCEDNFFVFCNNGFDGVKLMWWKCKNLTSIIDHILDL
jgi:hypothetical protein